MKRRLFVSLLFSWLCLVFVGTQAFAGTVYGVLQRDNDSFYLDTTQGVYTISSHVPSVWRVLRKLRNNDMVIGTGSLRGNELKLSQVDFVGLSELLGLWQSEKADLFEFTNFDTLNLYFFKFFFNSGPQKEELTYSIAPSNGPKWRIFFSGERGVQIGTLEVEDDTLILEIENQTSSLHFDPERDRKSVVYRLKRVVD